MLGRSLAFLLVIAIAAGGILWWLTEPRRITQAELPAHTGDAARGETIFFAGGCASCHITQGQQDPKRVGGGFALHSPFGTFYAPNISPDTSAGIGGWSEAQFVTALMAGTSPGGKHLYPSFPYTTYGRMKPEDAIDLFAYIKTLPVETQANRAHELPFPFNIRRAVGLWKLLYLDDRPIVADAGRPDPVNRGDYLVNALAHCGECHSPRNLFGAIIEDKRFSGGTDVETGGWVPNMTPGPGGIGAWTEDELVEMLTTGFTPEFDSVGGTMAEVVKNTGRLSDADRRAIVAYVKSLPPRGEARPAK